MAKFISTFKSYRLNVPLESGKKYVVVFERGAFDTKKIKDPATRKRIEEELEKKGKRGAPLFNLEKADKKVLEAAREANREDVRVGASSVGKKDKADKKADK